MAEGDDNVVLRLVLEIHGEVKRMSAAVARLEQKMSTVCNAMAAVVREAAEEPKPAVLCWASDLEAKT